MMERSFEEVTFHWDGDDWDEKDQLHLVLEVLLLVDVVGSIDGFVV